jgi:hypothetical protein
MVFYINTRRATFLTFLFTLSLPVSALSQHCIHGDSVLSQHTYISSTVSLSSSSFLLPHHLCLHCLSTVSTPPQHTYILSVVSSPSFLPCHHLHMYRLGTVSAPSQHTYILSTVSICTSSCPPGRQSHFNNVQEEHLKGYLLAFEAKVHELNPDLHGMNTGALTRWKKEKTDEILSDTLFKDAMPPGAVSEWTTVCNFSIN